MAGQVMGVQKRKGLASCTGRVSKEPVYVIEADRFFLRAPEQLVVWPT
jgi:hypothetical protein